MFSNLFSSHFDTFNGNSVIPLPLDAQSWLSIDIFPALVVNPDSFICNHFSRPELHFSNEQDEIKSVSGMEVNNSAFR